MSKKQYYYQTFRESYSVELPWFIKSEKGERFGFCSICRCDINIAHGGKTDISAHVKSAKHVASAKCMEENQKISKFFCKPRDSDAGVIRAECLFTSFLLEHNIALTAADHAGPLLKKMFPDSEIAKKYGCARTKTSAITKEMASNAKSGIVKCLQNAPFSMSTDGSNDTNSKLYPVVVTFFDDTQEKIVHALLSIPALEEDSTGRNIGNLLLSQLACNEIPIQNCIAFCSDNAAVMVGNKNGVIAVLKEKHPQLISIGCICHLVNLAAEKAVSALPVKIDEILVDIYYYLEKSSKRKERLQKFQSLHDTECKKILKHVCTRWLSLGRSLLRVFEEWSPLLSFFKEEVVQQKQQKTVSSLSSYKIPKLQSSSSTNTVETGRKNLNEKRKSDFATTSCSKKIGLTSAVNHDAPTLKNSSSFVNREEKLFMFLSSELNKAFCAFLLSVIPVFEKLNIVLQSASPHIQILREMLLDFLKSLISNFVLVKVVKSCPLLELNYHCSQNQKDDSDLVIGSKALSIVKTLKEEEKSIFYASIRNYFIAACDYVIHKFPLENDVLKNAAVARIENLENASFSSIRYFVNLFPVILPVQEGENRDAAIDEAEKQFVTLQVDDLPALSATDGDDVKWARLALVRGVDGNLKYDRICRIMLSILSIPHSNSECERVFSMVKKNRTQFRSSMANDTLEAISILKCRKSSICHEQHFTAEFLTKAKKATAVSLKSQCSTSS